MEKERFPTVRIAVLRSNGPACDDRAAETASFAAPSQMTGEGLGIGDLTW